MPFYFLCPESLELGNVAILIMRLWRHAEQERCGPSDSDRTSAGVFHVELLQKTKDVADGRRNAHLRKGKEGYDQTEKRGDRTVSSASEALHEETL